MSKSPDEELPTGRGPTIEAAAEQAARKVPKEIQDKWFELTIYAELSGEHNPLHGYRVVLSPGP
jgi:hypothetical protein